MIDDNNILNENIEQNNSSATNSNSNSDDLLKAKLSNLNSFIGFKSASILKQQQQQQQQQTHTHHINHTDNYENASDTLLKSANIRIDTNNDNASSTSNTNNSSFSMNYNLISTHTTSSSASSSSPETLLKSAIMQQQQHQQQSNGTNQQQQLLDMIQTQAIIANNFSPTKQSIFDNQQLLQSTNSSLKYRTQQQQQQQQQFDNSSLNKMKPQLPSMPPPTLTTQATTAYLVQTVDGNTLLIQPNHQPHSNNTSNYVHQLSNQPTLPLNRNAYNFTTVPLQYIPVNLNQATVAQTILSNSTSIHNANLFDRPESTASNVYQTIDADNKNDLRKEYNSSTIKSGTTTSYIISDKYHKMNGNGYLYPMDSFYETSTLNNSTKRKHKRNCQINLQQLQELQQLQQQQQQQQQQLNHDSQRTQFSKLDNMSTSGNLITTSTLKSNTNQTISNIVSPPLISNRRHDKNSLLLRSKYRLMKKFKFYCSWKCIALLFLFIIMNLFAFSVYLSVMRAYNLNWHLKENMLPSNNYQLTVPTKSNKDNEERKPLNTVLFSKIGDIIEDNIGSNEFFNIQLYIDSPMYIKFNITINKNSNIGIYGERNAAPSFTRFKFFETFNGNTLISTNSIKTKRSVIGMVNSGFVHYLEEGLWYISLYNDNPLLVRFRLRTEIYENANSNCPMNCFGKGECVAGKCQCFPGFSGQDCSINMCPVLCSGHGKYEDGKCICEYGWHGSQCAIPSDQCEIADCNGNGECIAGKCLCKLGFKGEFCGEVDCISTNCSNHGACIKGKCLCFNGYTGESCTVELKQTNDLCSDHGEFDYETKSCNCESGWIGLDCSENEKCADKKCSSCKYGWKGNDCQEKMPLACDSKCMQHGICVNGSCICSPGYQGRNCQTNNCPNSCSSHGICEKIINENNKYKCICNHGWTGKSCDVAIELSCNDEIDNDRDGLVDCMDSECCSHESCKSSSACNTSPEPKDRLLRKQPPSLSATFFEKMRFLIEDGSVQSFANINTFAESQVSIIRGQVLFKNGQPLIGVKVSASSNLAYGYTLTRNNGIFDLMVNGGGSVVLQFSKSRLKIRSVTVNAIWNQFVYIDPVVMYLSDDNEDVIVERPCKEVVHDSSKLYPIVKSSWKEIRTYYYDNALVLPDIGVIRNEISVMDTNLKLVYMSNQASGYYSTIYVLLTPDIIPDSLERVHMQIVIEGEMSKQTFDAYPNLKYEHAWDRRNAYEQRVYGFTYAKVSIGYQYEGCSFIYWQHDVVKINGYDLGSSEIGNWNFDIHHRLNVQQGILHKGDGTTIYVKELHKSMDIVAGTSKLKRDIYCSTCQQEVQFYAPYSISINKDGLVFIADYNYVWMLNNSEPARRILELRVDQPYKYYLANEPISGKLYICDSIKRQIYNTKSFDSIFDLKSNYDTNIGSGLFCEEDYDEDKDEMVIDCGDGDLARHVKMSYPKGFDFDNNGVMYFIDGNRIRSIDTDGKVKTLIGRFSIASEIYKPMSCNKTYTWDDFHFFWPTSLAVNPLDNTIYVLDENVIYKITPYKTIVVVAGVPQRCMSSNSYFDFMKLKSPVDMDFDTEGDLYVLENDRKQVKQIRVIKSNGEIETYFGDDNYNRIHTESAFDLFNNTYFNDPIAIAVHPNRSVYVLDQGDNVLYQIKNSFSKDESNGKYNILSPETREGYIFNRFGLHLSTIDLITGNTLYNFTYNGNALFGKLLSITDQSKKQLIVKRDFHGRAENIQTPNNYMIKLKLNNFDMLKSINSIENRSASFNYFTNTGLLTSKTESNGKTILFGYDKNGRVKDIVESNNMATNITYYINSSGIVTTINRADGYQETWISNGSALSIYKNNKLDTMIEWSRFNINMRSTSNDDMFNSFKVFYKATSNNEKPINKKKYIQVKRAIDNTNSKKNRKSKRSFSKLKRQLSNSKSSNFSFDIESITSDENKYNSVYYIKSNGNLNIKVEFDRIENTETYSNNESKGLLKIEYNDMQLPISFTSNNLATTNLTYDGNGKLLSWLRGNKLKEEYIYDLKGRLIEIKYNNGASLKYSYAEGLLPIAVTFPNRDHYVLFRDNTGNVQQIITPKQQRHKLVKIQSLNSMRLLYYPPEFKSPFVWLYDTQGALLQQTYPSNFRYVTYHRENDGELKKISWDRTSVSWKRATNPESSALTISTLIASQRFKLSIERIYSANLLTQTTHKFAAGRLADSLFQYKYDNERRMTGLNAFIILNAEFGERAESTFKSSISIKYKNQDASTLYERFNNFMFVRDSSNQRMLSIRDNNIQFDLKKDEFSRLTEINVKMGNIQKYKAYYEYDEQSRLKSYKYKLSEISENDDVQNEQTIEYTYDLNDRLTEVASIKNKGIDSRKSSEDDQSKLKLWQLQYDSHGNSLLVDNAMNDNKQSNLQVNGADQMMFVEPVKNKKNKIKYKFDNDGFVYRRTDSNDDLIFVFDSNQQLVKTKIGAKNNKTIEYVYDEYKRLIARKHYTGQTIQYFYADTKRPHLVTHVYDQSLLHFYTYYYSDENDRLFAIERNEQLFYVVTDLLNSPILIYDSFGNLVTQYSYDPLGNEVGNHNRMSSNGKFTLYLAFKNSIFDPEANILFINGGTKAYDPLSGRHLSPNLDLISTLFHDPTNINLYQPFSPKPYVDNDDLYFKSSKSWLKLYGYDFNDNLKSLNEPIFFTKHLPAKSSSMIWCKNCFIENMISKYNLMFNKISQASKLNTIYSNIYENEINFDKNKQQPLFQNQEYDVSLVNAFPLGNYYVAFTTEENSLKIPNDLVKLNVINIVKTSGNNNVQNNMESISSIKFNKSLVFTFNKYVEILLNKTVTINDLPNCIYNGHEVIYLYKLDSNKRQFEQELSEIGIKTDTVYMDNGVKLTVYRASDLMTSSEIRIEGNYFTIIIKYGVDILKEQDRYMKEIKQKSEEILWQKERQNVLELREYSLNWNQSDVNTLSTIGHVNGFVTHFIKNPSDEPQLLCDINNLKFSKQITT